MSSADWEAASAKALELFAFGQAEAAKRGLILVRLGGAASGDPTVESLALLRHLARSIPSTSSARTRRAASFS